MAGKQLEVQRMLAYPKVCEFMDFLRSTLVKLVDEGNIMSTLRNSDPRTYKEECARAKVALELLQVIGIKEYAIKTMYKHTNQDNDLMSIVDLAKIAESYKMEAELEDELLQEL